MRCVRFGKVMLVSVVTTGSVTSAGVIVTVTDYGFIVLKLS